MNTSRTERTDISSVSNTDENRITAHWKPSVPSSGGIILETHVKGKDHSEVAGLGDVGRDIYAEQSPYGKSSSSFSHPSTWTDSKGDRSPATVTVTLATASDRRNSSPVMPSLSGSPSDEIISPLPSDPASQAQMSPSQSQPSGEKPANSPVRKLSIHRAIGMLGGLLRRGAKENRASSASLDTGKDSTNSLTNRRNKIPLQPPFDLKSNSINYHDHTPLASSTPKIYSYSLDFHNITESQQLLQEALSKAARAQFDLEAEEYSLGQDVCGGIEEQQVVCTPRSDAAISDGNEGLQDDIGPLVPFDPLMSRYSSLSDMSHTNNHMPFGVNQFNSSSVFGSTLGTHDTLPPRPPSASTVVGSRWGTSDPKSSDVKTILPQFGSPENFLELQKKHGNSIVGTLFGMEEDIKIPKQSSSFTNTPSDRPVHRRNCNSLSSTVSVTSQIPSPDRHSLGGDKVSNRFNVGKSGFENKSDRKIPIFMRHAFQTFDGKYGKRLKS